MKHKFVRSLFAFLSVAVVLVTFSFNIFAADTPALFSSGFSYNDEYVYAGNTDILITLGTSNFDLDDSINISTSLNPCISYNMVDEDVDSHSYYTFDNSLELNSLEITTVFSDFEYSDDYFVSGLVPNNSWFASQFSLTPYSSSIDLYVDFIKVSARDFYFYLDPNNDVVDEYYDDFYAESFIYLSNQTYYFLEGAEGTIYYCLAGNENSGNSRQVYNYSIPTSDASSSYISTLPVDQSFSGTYSEPTLIYVEYFELFIPLDPITDYPIWDFVVTGTFGNYNMDYRNIDISSYEEPISPINPGIFRDYTGWIGTAVGGFLDLELVDGFSLGGILMVIIAFMITMWFLKVFAGG